MIGKKAITSTMAHFGCSIGRRYIQAKALTGALSTAERCLAKSPFCFGTRPYSSGARGETTTSSKLMNLLDSKKTTAEQELDCPKKTAELVNKRGLLHTLNTQLDSRQTKTTEQGPSEEGITLKKIKELLDLLHKKIEHLDFQHKKITEQEVLLRMSERLDSQQKKIAEHELLLKTLDAKFNKERIPPASGTSSVDVNNLKEDSKTDNSKKKETPMEIIFFVSVSALSAWLVVQVLHWVVDYGLPNNCEEALIIFLCSLLLLCLYFCDLYM